MLARESQIAAKESLLTMRTSRSTHRRKTKGFPNIRGNKPIFIQPLMATPSDCSALVGHDGFQVRSPPDDW
jgi:hypothetical protein